MLKVETLLDQTLGIRQMVVKLLKSIPLEQSEVIPPTWKNNVKWHAGHYIVVPQMLTHGLLGEELNVPPEYVKWFAKGTSPADWEGQELPNFVDLVDAIMPSTVKLADSLNPRMDDVFLSPYTTSTGVVLHSPAEALNFSLAHDGIHLGLLLALKRALTAQNG